MKHPLIYPSHLAAVFFAFVIVATPNLHGQQFWRTDGTSATWTGANWGTSGAGPFTSSWVSGSSVRFTQNSTSTFATTTVGNVTVDANRTVTVSQAGTLSTGSSTARIYDIGAGATLNWTTQNVSAAANQAGFIKNGDGIWNIGAQANAYNAANSGFTLNAGTVIVSGNNSFGGASSLLTINGGTIQSSGTRAYPNNIVIGGNFINSGTGNATFSGTVALGAATRTITNSLTSGFRTYSGVISGASGTGLTFNGSGAGETNITNAANTFSGDININGGEVRFTTNGSMGNAANDIIIDGGRFATASDATFALGAGRDVFVGDNAGTSISTPGAGTFTINTSIGNKSGETGVWAKQGSGTLELGGVSTYTGNTAINEGTVRLTTGNNRLPTGTVVSFGQSASANLGTLDLNARSQEIAGLNSITGTNATSFNNNVTSSSAATVTISGSETYSFGDGTNANSGTITGALAVVKIGSGTQTLGDANTYSGGTTISGGTLTITNTSGSATGSGTLTLDATGTLSGTGIIAPAINTNINLNGSLIVGNTSLGSPVASSVTLTTSGSGVTTTSTTSLFHFDLFTRVAGANSLGSAADYIKLPGTLDNTNGGTIVITNRIGPTTFALGDSWHLFDFTGGGNITDDFNVDATDLSLSPGLIGQFDRLSGTFTIVPEPSRTLFLALGLLTLTLRRRR